MTKTRRSVMVLLFMTMVLGVGLFLPSPVTKKVAAYSGYHGYVRSSAHPDWYEIPLHQCHTLANGTTDCDTTSTHLLGVFPSFTPANFFVFAFAMPRNANGTYPAPPSFSVNFWLRSSSGIVTRPALTRPTGEYKDPDHITYFYRVNSSASSASVYTGNIYQSNNIGLSGTYRCEF